MKPVETRRKDFSATLFTNLQRHTEDGQVNLLAGAVEENEYLASVVSAIETCGPQCGLAVERRKETVVIYKCA